MLGALAVGIGGADGDGVFLPGVGRLGSISISGAIQRAGTGDQGIVDSGYGKPIGDVRGVGCRRGHAVERSGDGAGLRRCVVMDGQQGIVPIDGPMPDHGIARVELDGDVIFPLGQHRNHDIQRLPLRVPGQGLAQGNRRHAVAVQPQGGGDLPGQLALGQRQRSAVQNALAGRERADAEGKAVLGALAVGIGGADGDGVFLLRVLGGGAVGIIGAVQGAGAGDQEIVDSGYGKPIGHVHPARGRGAHAVQGAGGGVHVGGRVVIDGQNGIVRMDRPVPNHGLARVKRDGNIIFALVQRGDGDIQRLALQTPGQSIVAQAYRRHAVAVERQIRGGFHGKLACAGALRIAAQDALAGRKRADAQGEAVLDASAPVVRGADADGELLPGVFGGGDIGIDGVLHCAGAGDQSIGQRLPLGVGEPAVQAGGEAGGGGQAVQGGGGGVRGVRGAGDRGRLVGQGLPAGIVAALAHGGGGQLCDGPAGELRVLVPALEHPALPHRLGQGDLIVGEGMGLGHLSLELRGLLAGIVADGILLVQLFQEGPVIHKAHAVVVVPARIAQVDAGGLQQGQEGVGVDGGVDLLGHGGHGGDHGRGKGGAAGRGGAAAEVERADGAAGGADVDHLIEIGVQTVEHRLPVGPLAAGHADHAVVARGIGDGIRAGGLVAFVVAGGGHQDGAVLHRIAAGALQERGLGAAAHAQVDDVGAGGGVFDGPDGGEGVGPAVGGDGDGQDFHVRRDAVDAHVVVQLGGDDAGDKGAVPDVHAVLIVAVVPVGENIVGIEVAVVRLHAGVDDGDGHAAAPAVEAALGVGVVPGVGGVEGLDVPGVGLQDQVAVGLGIDHQPRGAQDGQLPLGLHQPDVAAGLPQLARQGVGEDQTVLRDLHQIALGGPGRRRGEQTQQQARGKKRDPFHFSHLPAKTSIFYRYYSRKIRRHKRPRGKTGKKKRRPEGRRRCGQDQQVSFS